MTLAIAPLYIGLLAILSVILALRVSLLRNSAQIGIGSGDNQALERRIRVHGNFTEYAALGGVLLLALEALGFSALWLHGFGAALVISRVMHAIGLSASVGRTVSRALGTLVTWLVLLLGGLLAVIGFLGFVS